MNTINRRDIIVGSAAIVVTSSLATAATASVLPVLPITSALLTDALACFRRAFLIGRASFDIDHVFRDRLAAYKDCENRCFSKYRMPWSRKVILMTDGGNAMHIANAITWPYYERRFKELGTAVETALHNIATMWDVVAEVSDFALIDTPTPKQMAFWNGLALKELPAAMMINGLEQSIRFGVTIHA